MTTACGSGAAMPYARYEAAHAPLHQRHALLGLGEFSNCLPMRSRGSGAPRLANAAFFVFLSAQFGFWPFRPLRALRAQSLRIFPKPGLWRASQRWGSRFIRL